MVGPGWGCCCCRGGGGFLLLLRSSTLGEGGGDVFAEEVTALHLGGGGEMVFSLNLFGLMF